MSGTPETDDQAQRFLRTELVGVLTCSKQRGGGRSLHSNSQKPVFFLTGLFLAKASSLKGPLTFVP